VKRSVDARLSELAQRYRLPQDAASRLLSLLDALASEPDPHTTVPFEEAVDVHVADSLSALEVPELRSAAAIADVGSGAGFPGLPLAVALPARVDLVESTGRKAEVIRRLIDAAGASNARVVAERVEDLAGGEGREAYEAVTARAVGSLAVLVEYASPLLLPGGVLVAWKGSRDPEEEEAGGAAADRAGMAPKAVLRVEPYRGSRNRHLHVYLKTGPTPPGLPRRPGVAAKRPLR
jgi:16S rRNA (guanine527-N7)-methyltransferase